MQMSLDDRIIDTSRFFDSQSELTTICSLRRPLISSLHTQLIKTDCVVMLQLNAGNIGDKNDLTKNGVSILHGARRQANRLRAFPFDISIETLLLRVEREVSSEELHFVDRILESKCLASLQ